MCDYYSLFPMEVIYKIWSYLSEDDIRNISVTCRLSNLVYNNHNFWTYLLSENSLEKMYGRDFYQIRTCQQLRKIYHQLHNGGKIYKVLGVNCISTDIYIENIYQLSGRGEHSAFVTYQGKIYTFGSNSHNQLGRGRISSYIPGIIHLPVFVTKIVTGYHHTVFLTDMGEVYSFGCGHSGQTGLNSQDDYTQPTKICLSNVKDIECGSYHTVFLTEQGQVYTCGSNFEGQLGNTNKSMLFIPQIVRLPAIKKIRCGDRFTLCLSEDGKLYGFGLNNLNQLGIGDNMDHIHTPIIIPGIENVKEIACGRDHCVVLLNTGAVYGWGYNSLGQLGMGHYRDVKTPERILLPEKIVKIGANFNYTIYVGNSKKVYLSGCSDSNDILKATPIVLINPCCDILINGQTRPLVDIRDIYCNLSSINVKCLAK